jgi:crotonobetainyl-CoA:carnitine CoA-transferase CaiB-like acyl-CoA transferase
LERLQVPCGPVNRVDQVFSDPQVRFRGMRVTVPYEGAMGRNIDLIGSPIRMSRTPVSYRHAPPSLGQQTDDILRELLHMRDADIASLRAEGVVGS